MGKNLSLPRHPYHADLVRICGCGCGLEFKCSTQSTRVYLNRRHKVAAKDARRKAKT